MFSIKESIRVGWEKTKANFWKSVAIIFISLSIPFLMQILSALIERDSSLLSFPIYMAIIVAGVYLSIALKIGATKLFLRIYDGENPEIKEIFNTYGLFWRYLGQSILYSLIVVGGMILLVVPGIIFAIMYSFASIIIVDANIGIKASLKESKAITNGSKWKLLGFFIVIGLINILGYIALGVGIFVTIPITTFAMIHIYRELTKKKAGVTTPTESIPAPVQ